MFWARISFFKFYRNVQSYVKFTSPPFLDLPVLFLYRTPKFATINIVTAMMVSLIDRVNPILEVCGGVSTADL